MSLRAGNRLGPYEIIAPIGAGGMGQVYRARDPRIERDVAIKVLSGELSRNSERLSRFEREARAAGRLNHPNILVVYDVGNQDGVPYQQTGRYLDAPVRRRGKGAFRFGDKRIAPRKACIRTERQIRRLPIGRDRARGELRAVVSLDGAQVACVVEWRRRSTMEPRWARDPLHQRGRRVGFDGCRDRRHGDSGRREPRPVLDFSANTFTRR